ESVLASSSFRSGRLGGGDSSLLRLCQFVHSEAVVFLTSVTSVVDAESVRPPPWALLQWLARLFDFGGVRLVWAPAYRLEPLRAPDLGHNELNDQYNEAGANAGAKQHEDSAEGLQLHACGVSMNMAHWPVLTWLRASSVVLKNPQPDIRRNISVYCSSIDRSPRSTMCPASFSVAVHETDSAASLPRLHTSTPGTSPLLHATRAPSKRHERFRRVPGLFRPVGRVHPERDTGAASAGGSLYTVWEYRSRSSIPICFVECPARWDSSTPRGGPEPCQHGPVGHVHGDAADQVLHGQRTATSPATGEILSSRPYGIALQKNSPLTSLFNMAILNMQNDRSLESFKVYWWEREKVQCSTEKVSSGVQLKTLSGVFVLLGAGIGAGFVVLIVEFVCGQGLGHGARSSR
uniref:PBPe domain-containing protein n=1 Tax=Macrostomum lignano TaxID=282301 RepID=A0A1I8FGY9_9PLAT